MAFLPPLPLHLDRPGWGPGPWALPRALCHEPSAPSGELQLLAGEAPAHSPGTFDMSGVGGSLAEAVGSPPPVAAPTPTPPTRKTPESFLGPNAALVDLDSLVTRPGPTLPGAKASNPFLPSGACGLRSRDAGPPADLPGGPLTLLCACPLLLQELRPLAPPSPTPSSLRPLRRSP